MQFTINREALLKPLQLVTSVIERRQTLPILSNVFLSLDKETLYLLGTDMEVELSGRVLLEKSGQCGKTTAPARKLFDICKNLPEGGTIKFQQKADKLAVQCGRTRFNLATLPASDFPCTQEFTQATSTPLEFTFSQKALRDLIEATNFAMAQQDVRYYLNGMLWEVEKGRLRMVATDGHRLALSLKEGDILAENQVIVPRKAIYELSRLLTEEDEMLTVSLSMNQLRVMMPNYIFSSKLIEGKFPDYGRMIPQRGNRILEVDRDTFKSSLIRVGILSNDKNKSICLELKDNILRIFTNNFDKTDAAEDQIEVDYQGEPLTIVFNMVYLIDVLTSLPAGIVRMTMNSNNEGVRIESPQDISSVHVVMPMHL
jgi:DNA polymerase III subunit beta